MICVLVCKFFMHSRIVFLLLYLDTYHFIVRNNCLVLHVH
jgi:hypothetical protein